MSVNHHFNTIVTLEPARWLGVYGHLTPSGAKSNLWKERIYTCKSSFGFYTQALTYTTYTYKHNKNKNVKYKISGTLIVPPNFSFGGGNTYMHHT